MALKDPTENLNAYSSLLPAARLAPQEPVVGFLRRRGRCVVRPLRPPPSRATDSEMTDDDIVFRYDGENVVGITILHASQR